MTVQLSNPEDNKLVVLAKASRARTGAAQGAALRDLDGRTYAAATVDLPSLALSALDVCIAMAVVSGAKGAEAAVVLGDGDVVLDPLREFAGPGVAVFVGSASGQIAESRST